MRYVIGGAVAVITMAAALACSSGQVDKDKFEPLYRSAKNVEGALDVGVNILRYRELVQLFATEVSIANDKATSSVERELVRIYNNALAALKDAETLWGRKLTTRSEELTCTDPEVKRIAGDYPISGRGAGTAFTFKIDDAVQSIWRQARNSLRHGTSVYRGEPSPDLPEVHRP